MTKGHPDWFKGIVLYGIGPEEEFIPIRTDELGNLHVGYGTHAITHQDGGSDEISCEGLEGVLHLEQKSSWALVTGKPTTFTPSAHKASHQDSGGDEISVAGLLGVLTNEQPSSWGQVSGKPTTFTPSAHKTSHQNGGGDEISVGGLSGVLADAQTPASHGNTVHSPHMVEVDGTEPLTADWDIGDGRAIRADQIKARDAAGLKLSDKDNKGIFVKDGGFVGIGTLNPVSELDVVNTATAGTVGIRAESETAYCILRAFGDTYVATEFRGRSGFLGYDGDLVFGTTQGGPTYNMRFYAGGYDAAALRMILRGDNGRIGIGKDNPGALLDVNGEIKSTSLTASGAVSGVSLGVSGKSLLVGNAGASLLHWTTTVTTSWQTANLSAIVGARVALVLIEIRNNTGSNHMYCFAPAANNAYYYSDTTWERGTAVAQVDNAMRNFVIAITASNGYLYLRSDAVHGNATDFYLVGFI